MILAEAGAIALVAGFVLGLIGRQVLRSRVRLSIAEATLCGIGGAIVGGGLVTLVIGATDTHRPISVFLGAIAGTMVILLVVDRIAWQRRWPRATVRELIAGGESSRVEFKSSARYNLHAGARDARIEAVIVKNVAAFANAEGGCLLIGVTDDGVARGLAEDYSLMKHPDRDRYELWLRDLLSMHLGVVAAASIVIEFDAINGEDVCLLRVPASARPVFVSSPKEKHRAMFARTGNSTRELEIDEALAYCSGRWGRRAIRAALR